MSTLKNWLVIYYDKDDKIISYHKIVLRTEQEASNEAMASMPYTCEDWSMTEESEIITNKSLNKLYKKALEL